MRFEIDLASRRYRATRAIRGVLIGLIACLAGLLLLNGYRYASETRQLASLKAGLQQRTGPADPPIRAADLAELKARVDMANTLLLQRSFSVVRLLNSIEQAVPEGMTLQRLQISLNPSEIVMSGKAGRIQSLSALTDSLQAQKRFSDIFLTRQEETPDGNLTFELKFHYRPADRAL